jgi:alkylation response protein AidB-like acyl-CoA dehydrogenase
MDVRLSDEQRALRESALQMLDRLGPRRVADLTDVERATKLDAAVDASGWRELRAPAEDGEPWASAVEAAIVAEGLGRGLADTAFLGPTLAAELRRLTGAPPATCRETVAFTPTLSAPAESVDGAVPAGAVAIDARGSTTALLLVPATAGHALGQVSLDQEEQGVDLTRPVSVVKPGTPVVLLPEVVRQMTSADLEAWTALGLALACADLVGTMRGAVQLACEYAASRRQYGVAIGSFQAIQHLLADAFVSMEGSRSVALHAAWGVDALSPPDALAAASLAKAYCARAGRTVCEIAIQVHGGIGNTWECLAHLYLRRALVSGDVLGDVGASLARVLDHHNIGESPIPIESLLKRRKAT